VRYLLIALVLCGCGYEGDDMAGHNFVVDNVEFKEAKPGCHVYVSGNQTAPDLDTVTVDLDTEVFDHGDCWSTANQEYTVKVPGVYSIYSKVLLTDVDELEEFMFRIDKGGTDISVSREKAPYDDNWPIEVLMPSYQLDVGDVIKFELSNLSANDRIILGSQAYSYAMIQLIEM